MVISNRSSVSEVNVVSGSRAGGAAYALQFNQISNTLFRGNQATIGGAVIIEQKPGAIVIIGCTFENNQASGNSGAFYGRHPIWIILGTLIRRMTEASSREIRHNHSSRNDHGEGANQE
jgi:hypothetical protein